MRHLVALVVATLLSSALATGCQKGPQAQKCHLIEELVLYRSGATRLHGIALAKGERGLLAAWSDEDGVRTAVIDAEGRILHGPTRIREAKATSLDAVASPGGYLLAILEPADLFTAGGGAYLARIDPEGAVQRVERLGPAGAYSKRITVADPGAVAWHDGGPGHFVVRARLGSTVREIAHGKMGALAPAIARAADHTLGLAWVELEEGPEGSVAAPVRFARFEKDGRPRGEPRTVAQAVIQNADPVVLWQGRGFTVLFRDKRDGDRRAGYYVLRPDTRAAPVRVGRANGPVGPDVVYCHGTYAGAAVRTYQHELLLGFNRFDVAGAKRSGELQIYSDRVHFAAVDIECLSAGWALLYAEEHPEGARLLYNTVTCRE